MLFNSLPFFLFFPIVFVVYWLLSKYRVLQNVLLLVASYVFYGWWDPRFLILIFISSLADYLIGLQLSKASSKGGRKAWLGLSLAVNLGVLGYFKYADFFINSFVEAFASLGMDLSVPTLQIILPVGISFYTFQTLSYTIDIYRGKMQPTRDPISFFAFVSFFPQLVAGPIERAADLLPQFYRERVFSLRLATDGGRQALWGFFKKVVIADTCGQFVDQVFSLAKTGEGVPYLYLFGAILFTIQIYADFSGYSDIAIGLARMLGFHLSTNFRSPYLAKNLVEFWHRWHITLSTWFRDYVYIPLGGNRVKPFRRYFNVFATFLLSGLWHGAGWNFLIWGGLHGFFYSLTTLVPKPSWGGWGLRILSTLLTFCIVVVAFVFFRASDYMEAIAVFYRMLGHTAWEPVSEIHRVADLAHWNYLIMLGMALAIIMVAVEGINHRWHHGLYVRHLPRVVRWVIYLALIVAIWACFGSNKPFIYFQF